MIVQDEEHERCPITPHPCCQTKTQEIPLRICLPNNQPEDYKETEEWLRVAHTHKDVSWVEGKEESSPVALWLGESHQGGEFKEEKGVEVEKAVVKKDAAKDDTGVVWQEQLEGEVENRRDDGYNEGV